MRTKPQMAQKILLISYFVRTYVQHAKMLLFDIWGTITKL